MRNRRRIVASLVGLTLVAAACGGDDAGTDAAGDDASTEQTVDAGVADAIKDATGTTVEGDAATSETTAAPAPKQPESMEDWEALWEEERAAIVKKIKDGGYGISDDGKTALISDGYEIDLSKCPAGWNNTEGLTDTEIKIGHTTAQSGTLAVYGQIANGMQFYFKDVVNAGGGITDSEGKTRMINIIVKDDGYDSARTIPLVDELTNSDKVFAMTTLGSPNTMKTYGGLNERCIPSPLAMTGHPAWGDPINHPWTTGEQMAYNTEAVLWGSFIEERADELKAVDGKITVAALVMNNDFGLAYDGGFKAWLAQTDIASDIEYVTEVIEPAAPTITDPMTTLASKNPEVFIAMTAGVSCTQAITEAAQNGMREKALYEFISSVCKGASFVGKAAVGGEGETSNEWWVVGGGLKVLEAASLDTDPWAVFARKVASDNGVDIKTAPTTLAGSGRFAWTYEQILRVASDLDGGLTRVNLMVALRNFDMTAPFLLQGARFNLNGDKDAYMTEASEFAQYDYTIQGFNQVGDLIELSGKSSNCAWSQTTGTCG